MAKTDAKIRTAPKTQAKPKAPANAKGALPTKARARAKTTLKPTRKTTAASAGEAAPSVSSSPGATKLQILIDLLGRPHGASIAELMASTGWQAHSVRGALAGSLKKKGIVVTGEKVDGCRRYSIIKPGRT
jgi:hypothetical protein